MTQTSSDHTSGATPAAPTAEESRLACFADPGYRQLGASGLNVSVVGLGCNNAGGRIDAAGTDAVVGTSVDAGITLFDTADIYGGTPGQSEELLGRALGHRRDQVLVATKFGMDMKGVNGPDWLLTGKYRRGSGAPEGTRLASRPDRLAAADFDRIEAIGRFADERGISVLDVAVGGLAAQPAVGSVIAGATRPEQVLANVAAGRWQPTADDLSALDDVLAGEPAAS